MQDTARKKGANLWRLRYYYFDLKELREFQDMEGGGIPPQR